MSFREMTLGNIGNLLYINNFSFISRILQCLCTTKTHMPEPKNAISWVSIPAKDFDRAVRFYSNILDRTLEPMGEGDDKMAPFFPLETPGVNGGITADPSFTPTSDGVRIYLDVRGELENILERIEEA